MQAARSAGRALRNGQVRRVPVADGEQVQPPGRWEFVKGGVFAMATRMFSLVWVVYNGGGIRGGDRHGKPEDLERFL